MITIIISMLIMTLITATPSLHSIARCSKKINHRYIMGIGCERMFGVTWKLIYNFW